jgi:hypothetical protein
VGLSFRKDIQVRFFILTSALALASFFAAPAHAYNSVLQTGDLVEPGAFQAALAPQFTLSRYDGVSVDALLDVGIDNASSARGLIGVGDGIDFEVGGLYKYIPFPDTDRQPAIGGELGVVFARTRGKSELDFRFNPLLSKKFETEVGDVTPYASIPLTISFRDGQTLVPIQLSFGSELRLLSTPQLSFLAEAGLNLHDAFGYISGAIAWRFDEVKLKRTSSH